MRVTETIGPAWETMKRILFRPFNIGTWFSFGVVFALQSCAEVGGGNRAFGREHVGALILFWVVGAGFAIVAGLAGILGALITCCLGFLPVIHQTIMAPYYVFERAWTLEILASMSPDFDLRALPPEPHVLGGGGPYGGPYGGGPYGGGSFGSGGAPPNGGFGGGGFGPPGAPPGGGSGGGDGSPPPAGGFGGPSGF
jgi:hypothetical protein